MWQPLPIIGEAYADEALPWSAQDALNWIPVQAERPGTRSQWKYVSPPGLVEYADLGTNAPVRGTHDVEGQLLAVSGSTLFNVASSGVATALGTIPGVGRVQIAHNQVTNGYEVLVANGQSGYVYDTRDGTVQQVSDAGFPGLKTVDFIDGYLGGVEPQGRFWAHSELNQAKEWNTIDRYDALAAPDKMVGALNIKRDFLVMGERSGQFYANTGASAGTFQNRNGVEMDVGCAAAATMVRLDNSVFWLGNDGLVYRLEGYSPQIISTGPIAQAIAQSDIANAFGFAWEGRGHKVYYLTLPDGQTFGYDVWTQRWHRRGSFGLDRWRLNTLTRSRGQWIGGDFTNGKLYRLDWDVMDEAGAPLVSRCRGPVVHAEGNHIVVAGLKLVFDVGRVPAGVTDHFCSIRYSDDGGHNYEDARVVSIGASGQYQTTVEERRWGRTQQRTWEIEVSSPGKRDLIAASWLPEVTR